MNDIIMDRLTNKEPTTSENGKAAPDFVDAIDASPGGRISCVTAVQLHEAEIISDWELEFLLNTLAQEPCFTPIRYEQLKLPPLTYAQTIKRVLISLKVLRHYNRIMSQHYEYLDKIQAAD